MDFEKLNIDGRKIIVGIDFGTTYSGIAWAETQRPDRRMTNTTWPINGTNREGESSDKVPTKLRYAQDEIQWGFSIPMTAPQNEIIEWFKLDLDPSLAGLGQNGVKNTSDQRNERNAEKLVGDYFSALIDHLLYILRQKLGEGVVKNTPLEIVVTVPAIWNDRAKEKTKKACQRATELAKIKSPIHLISEPEAAAIFALHGLDPHGLKIGDTVVVVDAGGGTVDLISYTITGLKPILQVQEAAPGSGALCGSTFLNRRFAQFLQSKLGKVDEFDDEVLSEAMEAFEKKVKRQFTINAAHDETYPIPVGGLANNKELGISRGRFALKASDVMSIFEPVILEVIKLVKDQIDKSNVAINAILLVGGFGASNYLKQRIRNAVDKTIQVMQPPNAWQAVVQGAVMKGLANSAPNELALVNVANRRARRHYGVELDTWFQQGIHGHMTHKKYWDSMNGFDRITAMEWFIQRGDLVSENKPFTTSFSWQGPVSQGLIQRVPVLIFYGQDSKKAPLFRDQSVKELAWLQADISRIPEHLMNRRLGQDGQMYYDLEFKIESVYLSASTTYTLIYNDQRYDTVTCEYV